MYLFKGKEERKKEREKNEQGRDRKTERMFPDIMWG